MALHVGAATALQRGEIAAAAAADAEDLTAARQFARRLIGLEGDLVAMLIGDRRVQRIPVDPISGMAFGKRCGAIEEPFDGFEIAGIAARPFLKSAYVVSVSSAADFGGDDDPIPREYRFAVMAPEGLTS